MLPAIGDSIAVAGCCLTVVTATRKADKSIFSFDVIPETLTCTNLLNFQEGQQVNIERALLASDHVGGHFVQGHIDATEQVLAVSPSSSGEKRVCFTKTSLDEDYIVPKGSITIDGVSLTIADVHTDSFDVCLIPTTLAETTLGTLQIDQVVNIETDMLTRTVVQVVKRMQS